MEEMKSEFLSLTGFERGLVYQPADVSRIMARHLRLSQDLGLKNLYLLRTNKKEQAFLDFKFDDSNRVRVGPIGAYEDQSMAMWLNEQISEYVFQGTMGKSFPAKNTVMVEKLVGEMIDGFKEGHLVVSFEKQTEFGWQPYAGVTAYLGQADEALWKVVSEGKSSLSTFWALNHNWEFPADEIFLISENQILEMSRLWKRKSEVLSQAGISLSDIGWQSMAFLGLGIEEAVLSGYYRDDVAWVLYDTSRKIQESLSRHFGMKEVIDEQGLQPSREVLESVLAYHYGDESWGGYAGKIIVGKASLGEYSLSSKKFLKRKNIFTNLNIQKNDRVF